MPLSSSRGKRIAGWGAAGALSVACGTLVFAQRQPSGAQKPDPTVTAQQQAQQLEIQNAVRAADAAMTGQAAPADFPIQFQSDFLKAQSNRVWVPITLTFDSSKMSSTALTLYFRVTPRGMTAPPAPPPPAEAPKDTKRDNKKNDAKNAPPPAAPAYPYEDVAFIDLKPAASGQPARIQRGIGVPPGNYDLYIVARERAATAPAAGAPPAKTSILKQPLDVPNYGAGDFTTSTVILAERVDQLPAAITPDQQSEHPYAFGQTEIVPSPERKFKKTQELIVLFQIYNPNVTAEKKFNLEAVYTFYRQDAGAEKRFNSTEPQVFTPETMGGTFDPTQGTSSIQAGQGIPLQSFPEGTYRLEIKITDKLSSKVLTQNANFTVTP